MLEETNLSKVTEVVAALAEPVCAAQGVSLWDVEYVREAGSWVLRVFIDKEGGVSINDCVAVTQALDPLLDERDPIPDSYTFEVSSAGVERELKRPEHFARYIGAPVTVRLYAPKAGAREHTGTLAAYADGAVTLAAEDGSEQLFTPQEVAQVRLRFTF